jgi:hypothetical protein
MMRKYRYGSSYSSKPKNWLRSLLLVILVGLPVSLLALELGLKNFAPEWLGNKSGNTPLNYELKLTATNGRTLLPNLQNGDLRVKTSPVSGYDLVPNQATKFWQINAQGFRLDKPVSIDKDRADIRVFVVGNSTAFGSMAANNQMTIAPKLEQLLNNRLRKQTEQPRKFQPVIFPYFADQVEKVRLLPPRIRSGKYQVITAAVPGYTSTNELSLLVHKISEFKPDCLIFLNGYEDLRSPSNRPARELINLEDTIQQLEQRERTNNEQRFQTWLNSFYLVKAYQRLVTPSNLPTASGYYQNFNPNQLSNDPTELNLRVANYDSSLRKLTNLNSKIPIIIALQPEITGKSTLSPDEAKVVKALGRDYSDRITKSYKALESKVLERNLNNIKVISLYNAFSNDKEQIFIDPIHLTDVGNNLVANKLFNILEDTFKLQPQPAPEPS